MNDPAIGALFVWIGLNVMLTLALALNVTRHRFKSGSEGYDEQRLEKAIRAHGNNIEYVPIVLVCISLLVVFGGAGAAVWAHALGATLFVSRLFHAHGIQQSAPLPISRVIGNVGTWGVMLVSAIALIYQGLGG